MPTIHTRIEKARGCGYRKGGGLYIMGGRGGRECTKMPIPLSVCPCCSSGIKPTRGFTWINSKLFADIPCHGQCSNCAMGKTNERLGLLWVGEKFYATPGDFIREATTQGISRRIAQVPKEFKVGETWICFAHRKCIPQYHPDTIIGAIEFEKPVSYAPGIFYAFIPTALEYVVAGNETDEELQRMEDRGFTLVKVIRDIDAQQKIQV